MCRHVLSGHKDDILHIHVPSLGCDGTKIDPAATSAPTFGSPRPSDGPGPLPCPLLARVSSWIKSGSANPLISSLLANGTPTAHGAGNGFESPLMTSPKAEMYGGRTTPFPLHALGAATPAALVATCSADGTVRVWCSATWTCVGVFTCVEAPPAAAAARAPGFYLPWKFLCAAVFSGCLITGSMDGVCRIYSLDTVLAATKALIRKQAEMEGAWTSVPAALDLTATANGGAEGAGGGPSPKRRKIAEGAKARDIGIYLPRYSSLTRLSLSLSFEVFKLQLTPSPFFSPNLARSTPHPSTDSPHSSSRTPPPPPPPPRTPPPPLTPSAPRPSAPSCAPSTNSSVSALCPATRTSGTNASAGPSSSRG